MCDFVQIQSANLRHQDLVVVVYLWNEDKWSHQNLHIFARPSKNVSAKNDYHFVASAFSDVVFPFLLEKRVTRLELWSDGCRKHFKCRQLIHWWGKIHAEGLIPATLTMQGNYFASNHGPGPADAAGAQFLSKVERHELNYNYAFQSLEDMVSTIKLDNSQVFLIERRENLATCQDRLAPGIKLSHYHHWKAVKEGEITKIVLSRMTNID